MLAALDVAPPPALIALQRFMHMPSADIAKLPLSAAEPHVSIFAAVAKSRAVLIQ